MLRCKCLEVSVSEHGPKTTLNAQQLSELRTLLTANVGAGTLVEHGACNTGEKSPLHSRSGDPFSQSDVTWPARGSNRARGASLQFLPSGIVGPYCNRSQIGRSNGIITS